MALIQFCADYYHCPVGLAAAAALPRFFRRAGICRPPGGYRLCNDFYKPPTRRQKSWTIIELLEGGGVVSAAHIRRHIPNAAAELRRLLAEKIIKRAYLWDSTPAVDGDYFAPPRLTASQRQVLNEANCDGGFVPHLLLGRHRFGKNRNIHAPSRQSAKRRQTSSSANARNTSNAAISRRIQTPIPQPPNLRFA